MKKKWNAIHVMQSALFCLLQLSLVHQAASQGSVDSRICTCFPSAVSPDFMLGTKVFYGSVGIALSRDMEIQPNQLQPVKFIIPQLVPKAGCTTAYSIYISDDHGTKVYESAGKNNEITYRFPGCSQWYNVNLTVSAQPASGSAGNCSRRIHVKVKPRCNTTVCNCSGLSLKSKTAPGNADLNINGGLECLPSAGNQRRYVLKFGIVNKSNCILTVQTITVHGQTVEVPAFQTLPQTETKGISLGFSTALSQAPPVETKVLAIVRYKLNDKSCSTAMDLPYTPCK